FMRMGERWVLYIPWQSGYGTSGSGSSSNAIRGYSVLTFDMQLDSFAE
ncbi:FKBP-type peptidyl-prolyl cis-trans isomerase, partial [Bacteroides heparinolyticus]